MKNAVETVKISTEIMESNDSPIYKNNTSSSDNQGTCLGSLYDADAITEGLKALGVSEPFYLAFVGDDGIVAKSFFLNTFKEVCNTLGKESSNYSPMILLNPINKQVFCQYIGKDNTADEAHFLKECPKFLIEEIRKIAIDIHSKIDSPSLKDILKVLVEDFGFPQPSILSTLMGVKLIFNTNLEANFESQQFLHEFVEALKENFKNINTCFISDYAGFTQLIEIPCGIVLTNNEQNLSIVLKKSSDGAILTKNLISKFTYSVQQASHSNLKHIEMATKGCFNAKTWIEARLKSINAFINSSDGLIYADIIDPKLKTPSVISMNKKEFFSYLSLEVSRLFSHMLTREEREIFKVSIDRAVANTYHFGRRDDINCRIANIGGVVYYDLHTQDGLIYAISPEGNYVFQKETSAIRSLHFSSSQNMKEQRLPLNTTGLSLMELLDPFLNMSFNSKVLLIVTIICWFIKGSNYFLWLRGPNGSGKSLLTAFLTDLVDPSNSAPGTLPTSVRELSVTLASQYLIVFDNLSKIHNAVSDLLCQSAYGGTYKTRTLYTNSDTTTLKFHNAIIFNSISDEVVKKPDLLQRIIPISLLPIQEGRRSESSLRADFGKVRQAILFEIFATLSKALKILPEIVVPSKFRMMDAAQLGCAISRVLWDDEHVFINAFEHNAQEGSLSLLEDNPVTHAVLGFLREQEEAHTQSNCAPYPLRLPPISAEDFHKAVVAYADKNNSNIRAKGFAPDAPALTKKLKNYSSSFKNLGIEFLTTHTNKCNLLQISIEQSLVQHEPPILEKVA